LTAADDDEYRRASELVAHLGLDQALRKLAATALKSSDAHIREVGADFRR